MKKLFIDDIRNPIDVFGYTNKEIFKEKDWIIVRTYEEFTNYLTNNNFPDIISFDHDLSDTSEIEKTGYDCAKFLVDFCMDTDQKVPIFFVHSQNPIGGENIKVLLNNFKKFQN
jgi:hypothetical protein